MNLRLVLSGAGVLAAAGAVIGGVALAQSPSPHHPAVPPAAVVSTTEAPPSVTVAATTSAAPVAPHPSSVARSTHHAVAPKETTVANQPAEQTSTRDAAPISNVPVTADSAGRAGNAPPPPAVTPPAVELPTMTVPNDQQP